MNDHNCKANNNKALMIIDDISDWSSNNSTDTKDSDKK